MSDFNNLVASLRTWSKCKDFPKLTREWDFVAWRDGGAYGQSNCICGHKLRYEYLIKNRHSKVQLIVGSKCIQHFPTGALRTELDEARKAAERAARKKRAIDKKVKDALAPEWVLAFEEGRAEFVPLEKWDDHLGYYYDYIQLFEVMGTDVKVMYYTPGRLPEDLREKLPSSIYGVTIDSDGCIDSDSDY